MMELVELEAEGECSKISFNLANVIEIDEDIKNAVCYREQLIIGKFAPGDDLMPVPVGGMCLDIQCFDDKFIVYVSTKFGVDQMTAGSKITSWINADLTTIEEKRTEFFLSEPVLKQCLYIAAQADSVYYVNHVGINRCSTKNTFNLAATDHLMCEGADFLLMRLLALRTYIGHFETTTFYINGDLCRNVYQCTGPEISMVNHRETTVCKIRRSIFEKCGIVHYCITTLAVNGRIINNEWHECPYVVHINPLADVDIITENLPLALTWKDDLEMYSKYLDKKQLCAADMDAYMTDNPELVDLLADYVTDLLHFKPEDVLAFSMEHFRRYSK